MSFDEKAAAFLCYTSGTTVDPKGVLYSHRSVVLHAITAGLYTPLGLRAFGRYMPCTSPYHPTAWGLAFVAAITGRQGMLPDVRIVSRSLQQLLLEKE